MKKSISSDDLERLLSKKADSGRMDELEQLIEHVRDTNIQSLEDSEANLQRLDQEMA